MRFTNRDRMNPYRPGLKFLGLIESKALGDMLTVTPMVTTAPQEPTDDNGY